VEFYKPLYDNCASNSNEGSETVQKNVNLIKYVVFAAEIYKDNLIPSPPDALVLNVVKIFFSQEYNGQVQGNFVSLDHNGISDDHEFFQGDQMD